MGWSTFVTTISIYNAAFNPGSSCSSNSSITLAYSGTTTGASACCAPSSFLPPSLLARHPSSTSTRSHIRSFLLFSQMANVWAR